MGKNKVAQPAKASKASKDSEVKSLSSVKQGAVTKPSQTPKSKSKEMAKQVAVKADKVDKKSKKTKKEPTPEPESDSEEDASSSEDDSEIEAPAPAKAAKSNGVKTNGAAKASALTKDESSDSSDSSSDDEPAAPKPAAVATAKAVAGAKAQSGSEDDSDDSSAGSSDSEGKTEVKGAVDAKVLNGKLETVASKEASSDDESDSDAEGTSADTSDESSDDESVEAAAPEPKKRKAEAEAIPAIKRAKTDAGVDDDAKKNLFVGHLSYNIDEDWLTKEFEEYGELTRVKIIYDRDSGQSKGFGYVEFANAEDGVKAQAAMHEKEIDGRAVNVDFSKPKGEAAPRQERQKTYGDNPSPASETIFVANLPFEITEDAVAEEFQKHGNVLGVRLPTDRESGNPKGFGYVQFGSVEESQEVFGKMTGAVIMGRPIRMDYSTPRPPREDGGSGGRGGFDRGGRGGGRGGRGGYDRGGRGGGRGRGGFDRGGGRGGRGGSTNRGGFGDFKGQKKTF